MGIYLLHNCVFVLVININFLGKKKNSNSWTIVIGIGKLSSYGFALLLIEHALCICIVAIKKEKRKKPSSSFVIYWFFNNINYLAHDVYYNAMNLNYSASSKATTKELERIDALYYSYANGSSAMIE